MSDRWDRMARRLQAGLVRLLSRRRGDESGQAIMIVLGLVTMLSLGTLVMVQNVAVHFPIVQQDLESHEAYRAMQAGLNEYLYVANANPDSIMCDASVYKGYPGNWGTPSNPNISSSLCQLPFDTWVQVPNLAPTKGPNSWYMFDSPKVYQCTNSSKCASTAWVTLNVVGASGSPGFFTYDTASATLDPANSFLLNLWWLNFDQEDPTMLSGTPACNYYWAGDKHSLVSGCQPVDFVTGESLTGNIYSNDSVFVCGSPTIDGTITTADEVVSSGSVTVPDPTDSSCGNSPQGTTGQVTTKGQTEPIPTDDAVLDSLAAQGGCLYEGPTEIFLGENGSSQYGMYVYSPDTPTGGDGTSPSNDSINDPGNANACLPSTTTGFGSTGGWVPYPSNGVVFVEDCLSTNTICNSCPSTSTGPNANGVICNPLYDMDQPGDVGEQGPTDGDAIVEGTVQGPLTIAAENNAVITGNLCYQSWLSPSGGWPNCSTAPSSLSTADVLGLVSYNYIEVNHPMTKNGGSWANDSACSWTLGSTTYANLAPMGPSGNLACDIDSSGGVTIDAAILALNQQFFDNNFNEGASLGNINVNGTIGEDWRGPVGTEGSSDTGYLKQYNYDTRLEFLSPPDYLNPGTSSWVLGAISTTNGSCPSSISGCSTTP